MDKKIQPIGKKRNITTEEETKKSPLKLSDLSENRALSTKGVDVLLKAAQMVTTNSKITMGSSIEKENLHNLSKSKICLESSTQHEDLSLDEDPGYDSKSKLSNFPDTPFNPLKCDRRLKSLKILCLRFLEIYLTKPEDELIRVDELSERLAVERRRIYDIMNIFMAIFVISKRAKNCYVWHGLQNLEKNINVLMSLPIAINTDSPKLMRCSSLDSAYAPNNPPKCRNLKCGKFLRAPSFDIIRKEKSLELLAQQFIALLMRRKFMCMDELANILIESPDPSSTSYNTKIRRLYDIANVLSTLKMIERVKIETKTSKKLAFKYLGVDYIHKITNENVQSLNSYENQCSSKDNSILSTDSSIATAPTDSSNTNIPNQFQKDLETLIEKHPKQWKILLDPNYVLATAFNTPAKEAIKDEIEKNTIITPEVISFLK